jgi:RNA recognition motif. (a.k.a. RRM, RBD, or RNP domain)
MDNPSRVFVSGIPVRIEKQGIMDFFSQFGAIKYCKIKKNSKTGRSLGYAYITFEDSMIAQSLINKQIEFEGRICECREVVKKEELVQTMEEERKRKLLVYELHPKVTNEILSQYFSQLASISHAYVLKDTESEFNKGYGYVAFESQEALHEFVKRRPTLHLLGCQVRYSDHMKTPPKRRRPKPVEPISQGTNLLKTASTNSILKVASAAHKLKDLQILERTERSLCENSESELADQIRSSLPELILSGTEGLPAVSQSSRLHSPQSAVKSAFGRVNTQILDINFLSKDQMSQASSSGEDSIEQIISLTCVREQPEKTKQMKYYSPWGHGTTQKHEKKFYAKCSQANDHLVYGYDQNKLSEIQSTDAQDQIYDDGPSENETHFMKPTNSGYKRVKRVDDSTMNKIHDYFSPHQRLEENYKYNGLTKVAYIHGSTTASQ